MQVGMDEPGSSPNTLPMQTREDEMAFLGAEDMFPDGKSPVFEFEGAHFVPFSKDRGLTDVNELNLRALVEQVTAEQLNRLERRVKFLEVGPSPVSSPHGPTMDSSPKSKGVEFEGHQAVQLRDHDIRLARLSKDISMASESHRLQILKVTQAVGELGRELTSRVERIENAELTSRVERIENAELTFFVERTQNADKSRDKDHQKLIEELYDIVRSQENSLIKQESAVSALRDDLKFEQRIRKDEINPKLREFSARPVRPEEQSINDLRQSIMSVRDECSKLRAECRKLSNEAVARDSEVLSRVLRQLSDMRSLLDNGTSEEEVGQQALGLVGQKAPHRAGVGDAVSKSARTSPARDRTLQVRSMSAKKLASTRGSLKSSDSSKALSLSPNGNGDEAKGKAARKEAEDPSKASPQRRDDASQLATMGTTSLAFDASHSPSPIDMTKPQQSRSKSPEGLKSQEILQATLSTDRRTQAAVPPGQLQQPKAFAMVPPQGINEIASRAGSPGPLLYARPCTVPQQTSPPVQASPLGRVQMRAKPSSAAAPPRITSFPVSCQVIPIGYKSPPPRPISREMLNLVNL